MTNGFHSRLCHTILVSVCNARSPVINIVIADCNSNWDGGMVMRTEILTAFLLTSRLD